MKKKKKNIHSEVGKEDQKQASSPVCYANSDEIMAAYKEDGQIVKSDIQSYKDVQLLVDTFYSKVFKDSVLGDIFKNAISEKEWPEHLERIYKFWETVLLGNYTYRGSPFAPHAKLPIEAKHFERWLVLFNEIVDQLFEGRIADDAKTRADKMAQMFQYKLNAMRKNPDQFIQ